MFIDLDWLNVILGIIGVFDFWVDDICVFLGCVILLNYMIEDMLVGFMIIGLVCDLNYNMVKVVDMVVMYIWWNIYEIVKYYLLEFEEWECVWLMLNGVKKYLVIGEELCILELSVVCWFKSVWKKLVE